MQEFYKPDMTYMTSVICVSNRNVMCQGGEGKGERVFEVQNDIGAKPFRKNKILHSHQFSLGPGSAVREKLKREKIGELSDSLGGLGKRVHVIFLCPSTTFFPNSGAWSGYDQL